MDARIKEAVRWIREIAADDSHGYSQENRNSPDYDCSSLVCSALHHAGFDVDPTSYTGNMYSRLKKVGFVTVDDDEREGDIYLTPGKHTVMVIAKGRIVHAIANELGKATGGKPGDQTGREICEDNFYVPSYGWKYHLRYPDKDEDIVYSDTDSIKDNIDTVAFAVMDGQYGNGIDRVRRLTDAGHDAQAVQARVNAYYKMADAVIIGKYGNGEARKANMKRLGYDYDRVQRIVNETLKAR